MCTCTLASLPGLPRFCSLVCIQYNTRKWKSGKKKRGRPGNTYRYITWMTSGGREVDVRGAVPVYKLVFLTGEVGYCRSCECLGSWLLLECSMMKYSMLFECGHHPLHVHLVSTRHCSCDSCSRPSPFFAALLLLCKIYWKNTNEEGLGYSCVHVLVFENDPVLWKSLCPLGDQGDIPVLFQWRVYALKISCTKGHIERYLVLKQNWRIPEIFCFPKWFRPPGLCVWQFHV